MRDEANLNFACALARQCFINDYVFAQDEEEVQPAAHLRDTVVAATVSPLKLAVLAAYIPLHDVPEAAKFLDRKWPRPVSLLLDQQLRQPVEELNDRAGPGVDSDRPIIASVRELRGDALSALGEGCAREYEPIKMPRNSAIGFVNASVAVVTGFALIWQAASLGTRTPCACCGSQMRIIEVFKRGQTSRPKPSPRPIVIRIDPS